MDKATALAKIKKCLALSKSPNEHEAAAAMRQAQKLMATFGINERDADVPVIDKVVIKVVGKSLPGWAGVLAMTVARALGVKAYRTAGKVVFYGDVQRLPLAEHAFMVLTKACNKAAKVWGDAEQATRSERNGFRVGFASGVGKTVQSLVLSQAEMDAISAWRGKNGLVLGGGGTTRGNAGGYGAGQAAGGSYSMNRPVGGSGSSALRLGR